MPFNQTSIEFDLLFGAKKLMCFWCLMMSYFKLYFESLSDKMAFTIEGWWFLIYHSFMRSLSIEKWVHHKSQYDLFELLSLEGARQFSSWKGSGKFPLVRCTLWGKSNEERVIFCWNFARGTIAKAQGTTTIYVGAVGRSVCFVIERVRATRKL